MVALAGAAFIVIAAVWLVLALKAPAHVMRVVALSRESMAHVRDANLTDDEKEALFQKQSLAMFRLFFLILLAFVVALGAPVGALWLLGRAGLVPFDEIVAMSLSVEFLVGCTVVGVLVAFAVQRLRRA